MRIHRGEAWSLIEGDCVRVLRAFGANRFDSIVTDPPYELGFMGKAWDGQGIAFSVELWREVLRVLKPGGHLLAFGGTRTYHRQTCAIEDAGFEIRDSLHWLYGTGFPKSKTENSGMPAGTGTALKPAHEPVVLARKPLIGTIAANVLAHGTGALQIDACRIATGERIAAFGSPKQSSGGIMNGTETAREQFKQNVAGRWPANVLFDEDAAAELDAQSGITKSSAAVRKNGAFKSVAKGAELPHDTHGHADSGGASRFFYVAKPSRAERDRGCEHLPARSGGEATDREDGSAGVDNPRAGAGRTGGAKNHHPTVKPITLMRYLVRLITPPGGCVLDPFTGSGTTGIAARLEGYDFVGVEREAEYATIAAARIQGVSP